MKFSRVTRTHQMGRRCKVFSFFPSLLGKGDKGIDAPPPAKPHCAPCEETEIVDLRDRAAGREFINSTTPNRETETEPLWQTILGCLILAALFLLALFIM